MSFSYATMLLQQEPTKPAELNVGDLAVTLADYLNMNPHEVQYLLGVAHSDAGNMIVSSHWGKLLAVIKLRDSDGLQTHMTAVRQAQINYESELKQWRDRLREARDDFKHQTDQEEREFQDRFHQAKVAYARFIGRLETEGRSLRSFTSAEEALLKHLQKHYTDMRFKRGIGFVKGRYVRLITPAPELKENSSWYHLVRALVDA